MFISDENYVHARQEALLCKAILLKNASRFATILFLALFTFSFVNAWEILINISILGLVSILFIVGSEFILRTKISDLDYASEIEAHCLLLLAKQYSEIKDAIATLDTLGRPMLRCEAKRMCKWVNQHENR